MDHEGSKIAQGEDVERQAGTAGNVVDAGKNMLKGAWDFHTTFYDYDYWLRQEAC